MHAIVYVTQLGLKVTGKIRNYLSSSLKCSYRIPATVQNLKPYIKFYNRGSWCSTVVACLPSMLQAVVQSQALQRNVYMHLLLCQLSPPWDSWHGLDVLLLMGHLHDGNSGHWAKLTALGVASTLKCLWLSRSRVGECFKLCVYWRPAIKTHQILHQTCHWILSLLLNSHWG